MEDCEEVTHILHSLSNRINSMKTEISFILFFRESFNELPGVQKEGIRKIVSRNYFDLSPGA